MRSFPMESKNSRQDQEPWSRRFFLQSSLAGMAFLGSQLLFPQTVRPSALPEGHIRLYNTHTGERLSVTYRSTSGRYDREALQDINHLLRCNYTRKVHRIDIRLLEFLNKIEKTVGAGKEVQILSGYRSPSHNFKLVLHEQGAVTNSFHTKGQAMDFFIHGVRLSSIQRSARRLHLGGVGTYRKSGFIHIDTGRPRFW